MDLFSYRTPELVRADIQARYGNPERAGRRLRSSLSILARARHQAAAERATR